MVKRKRTRRPAAETPTAARAANPDPTRNWEQLSLAERAAAARDQQQKHPLSSEFARGFAFPLDSYQLDAMHCLEAGSSVLVAAPTGAGKTVVGEFGLYLALSQQKRAFYTTPIKALSNQKFKDLAEKYGAENIGLATGDTSIRVDAPIVVMTTEILRNMIYRDDERLADLGYVVLDEVHYLADKFRGPVWEEIILHLSPRVQLIALSATVSNVEEFGQWLREVRGDTRVVLTEHRPVPLKQHMIVGSRIYDLYARENTKKTGQPGRQRSARGRAETAAGSRTEHRQLNPALTALISGAEGPRGGGHGRGMRKIRRTSMLETVCELERENLLPGIVFIFSRAGCDEELRALVAAGIRLTSKNEREEIRAEINSLLDSLPDQDWQLLGLGPLLTGLEHGIAAHHAGLLPVFKELVEKLFSRGLIKVVFATETLALGINMPARSVVLRSLTKWDGSDFQLLTPGQYTQLTGRAGRRGIDTLGHALVAYRPGIEPQVVASLASKRTYPLNSAFTPTYNMVVNLLANMDIDEARRVLAASFAQFQIKHKIRPLRDKARGKQKIADEIAARGATQCNCGDTYEYTRLVYEYEQARARREQPQAAELRREMQSHRVHACPERTRHLQKNSRWLRAERQAEQARAHIDELSHLMVRTFDAVVAVLKHLDYLNARGQLTADGRMLTGVYSEYDLLLCECLRRGIFTGLAAEELAAVVSAASYEPRRETEALVPPRNLKSQVARVQEVADELRALQARLGAPELPENSSLMVDATYRWASGASLLECLDLSEQEPGDFVRSTKQLIDTLRQLRLVADGEIAVTAAQAIYETQRGIITWSEL